MEFFVFSLAAEMRGEVGKVQLYAISRGGELTQFNGVNFNGKGDLPCDGALSNPADLPLVTGLQDQMIAVYGNVIAWKQCAAADEEGKVDLGFKMLRAEHLPALCEAVAAHGVTKLYLTENLLGPEAGAGVAEVLRMGVEELYLSANKLGDAGVEALAAALKEGAGAKLQELHLYTNGITAKGAQALAGCLAACGSLERLVLQGNELDDAGKQTLREAVAGRKGFRLML